jgi:hypothetical protein
MPAIIWPEKSPVDVSDDVPGRGAGSAVNAVKQVKQRITSKDRLVVQAGIRRPR